MSIVQLKSTYIRRSDPIRFGDLQKSLLEGSHCGLDEYPTTFQDVYALMVRQPNESQVGNRKAGNRGQNNYMFAMIGKDNGGGANNDEDEMVPGTDGKIVENVCYICRKKGHILWYCPEAGNKGPPPRSKKGVNCAQFGLV